MRKLDNRLVRNSIALYEGVDGSDPDVEQLDFVLRSKSREVNVCLDIGDKVFTESGDGYWAPLYFLDSDSADEASEKLVSVLYFSNDVDPAKAIKSEEKLPNNAISRPRKGILSEETWEKHKNQIRREMYADIGAVATLASVGVISGIIGIRKIKKTS